MTESFPQKMHCGFDHEAAPKNRAASLFYLIYQDAATELDTFHFLRMVIYG